MGMRDESWCAGCGGHIQFTEDEDAMCGACEKDIAIDFIEGVIRYVENTKNELEERLQFADGADPVYNYLEGAVEYTDLILLEIKDRYQNA